MKPDRVRTLSEGLVAGLLGGLAVILFYGVLNLLGGRSFFATAAQLGADLVAPGTPAVGAVLAFNGLHVVAFLLVGLVAAWIVRETERHPGSFVLAVFIGIAGLFAVMAAFLSFTARAEVRLPIGTVFVANLLAGVAMGNYLLRAHPGWWRQVRDGLDPEAGAP